MLLQTVVVVTEHRARGGDGLIFGSCFEMLVRLTRPLPSRLPFPPLLMQVVQRRLGNDDSQIWRTGDDSSRSGKTWRFGRQSSESLQSPEAPQAGLWSSQ